MENLQGGTLALEHRYQIDERLAKSGLVTIYAGTQDPFDLPVRIVVYDGLVEAGAHDAVVDRIKASARRSSYLQPEGLLATADFGEIDRGVPFVIEETIAGSSLATLIDRRGVFSPDDVADLVDRLAALLSIAHKSELYHGHLTGHFIIVPPGDDGLSRAQLSHFELGLSMAELLAMPQAVLTTDLVEAFAPEAFEVASRDQEDEAKEQSPSPHLSAAADQWALAALCYRLLVGVHPFFDDPVDASEGILRIKTEEAGSLAEMGVSPAIADVIDRALKRDPQQRWPSVKDFARALRTAVDPSSAALDGAELDDDDHRLDSPQGLGAEESAPAKVEYAGPRPSGYLLTIALAALILTNLGWFFFALADQQESTSAEEVAAVDSSTIPSGLQVHTSPPGAEIFVIEDLDAVSEDPLGSTPFVISNALRQRQELNLMISLPGYRDQHLIIEDTAAGQDLRIILIPDAPDLASETGD